MGFSLWVSGWIPIRSTPFGIEAMPNLHQDITTDSENS